MRIFFTKLPNCIFSGSVRSENMCLLMQQIVSFIPLCHLKSPIAILFYLACREFRPRLHFWHNTLFFNLVISIPMTSTHECQWWWFRECIPYLNVPSANRAHICFLLFCETRTNLSYNRYNRCFMDINAYHVAQIMLTQMIETIYINKNSLQTSRHS